MEILSGYIVGLRFLGKQLTVYQYAINQATTPVVVLLEKDYQKLVTNQKEGV